jgi:adenylate cyclase class 2
MAFEIELKTRLGDPEPVRRRLDALGKFLGSYEKNDAYWFPAGEASGIDLPPSGLRVRHEADTDTQGRSRERVLVTYKTKETQGGIEVNDEQEFAVSDAAAFEKLLARMGLRVEIRKEKRGSAWNLPEGEGEPVLAELSMVKGLGWFLEIEILAAGKDDQTMAQSRLRLLSLLAKFGIGEDQIEGRPYTELLRRK